MILQLDPPIPVYANGRKATAYGWLDYSQEHDLLWLVAYDDTGEFWCVNNRLVRARENLSLGRPTREGAVQDQRHRGD